MFPALPDAFMDGIMLLATAAVALFHDFLAGVSGCGYVVCCLSVACEMLDLARLEYCCEENYKFITEKRQTPYES